MAKHSVFYKNALWQYGLQIVKYLFPLITLPYLTRVLEPEGYAVYAYVVSFMTFIQAFVDFGFTISGTREIAKARSVEEENRIVGAVTQARLLLCAVACMAVLAIALVLPITRANLAYTMIAFVAVCGKALAPDFLFQGREQMAPLTTRFFVSKGASTALTFVFVHSVGDIIWVPLLDILSSAIALVWSFAAAKRMFGTTVVRVSMRETLREFKISAAYAVSSMSSTAFNGFATMLVGVVVKDTAQVSYWSLAMTAVSAVQALYTPISNSLYPHMVRGRDFAFARRIILVSLPFVLLGTVLFAFLSRVVVLALGGNAYLDGSWVMVAISPVLFFSFYSIMLGWPVVGASGKVRELTTTTVGSSLLCAASLLICTALGIADLPIVCLVRVATEAIFCISRLVLAKPLLWRK